MAEKFKFGRWIVSDLPDNFFTIPSTANATMDTMTLKAILLKHQGCVMACGYQWDIKSKRIGPGVYRVWLEQQT